MFKNNMDILLRTITLPFTNMDFYKKDYIEELSKENSYKDFKEKYSSQDGLMEAVLRDFISKQIVLDLDTTDLLVNKYYGHKVIKNKSFVDVYLNILSKLQQTFICHRNGRIALKYWENVYEEDFIGPYKGINKIALWNLLNRIIGTEIIVIKYLLDNNMRDCSYLYGYYSSIVIEDIQLEKILQKGVAETHIHKGAAINFSMSWIELMNNNKAMYSKQNLEDSLYKNINISSYLKVLGIVRIVMGMYIKRHDNNKSFGRYLSQEFNVDLRNKSVKNSIKQQDIAIYELINMIYEGKNIDEGIERKYKIDNLYNRLLEKYKLTNENNYLAKMLYTDDVMNKIFDEAVEIRTTSENVFLFEAIKYIEKNREDECFAKIFFQYLRIKNYVFQGKIQSNNIKGLNLFKRYFNRSAAYASKNGVEYWKILIENQLQNEHLKKLELRTSFNDKKSLKDTIVSFLKAYKEILEKYYMDFNGEDIPKIGLIFNMIKQKDKNGYDKCWQNLNENQLDELYYMENRKHYMIQVKDLNELRSKSPGLDNYILGIDAASIENDTDPWVFAPVYEGARDSTSQKLIYDNSSKRRRTRNLGFTFHVGEDFRHIISGLRKIDEVIEHFKFHAGDRIGHGIALGIDIDCWIKNNGVVTLPRGEYLDNLLWIWGIHKQNGYLKELDISFLECKIMSVAEKILDSVEGVTVYKLWKAYQSKFKNLNINKSYFSCNSSKNIIFCKYLKNTKSNNEINTVGEIWTYESLTYVQHCHCYLVKIMEPIQVEVDKINIKLYSNLQKMLIEKISTLGIVVETNPTSNLAVGYVKDLFHHYIFNLNNRKENQSGNSVIVTINSDDPSVFNTNVSSEMAYIFYALQEYGYSREDALEWIDKIRRYGMETSFIDNRNITCKELVQEITAIINCLK